ncbi:bacteriocin-like WGxF protein [Bacillus sp. Bos-x628]|uniref:bacteriocin-like WGxF protein n=1 Tax=Bacillus maqinnsis TaxID=3229854 RepID=UPI00338E230D
MKHIVFALSTSVLIVMTGVIHRVIFRMFNLPFDQAIFFWGGFVVIYFVLALLSSLLFRNIGSNSRKYEAS